MTTTTATRRGRLRCTSRRNQLPLFSGLLCTCSRPEFMRVHVCRIAEGLYPGSLLSSRKTDSRLPRASAGRKWAEKEAECRSNVACLLRCFSLSDGHCGAGRSGGKVSGNDAHDSNLAFAFVRPPTVTAR